MSYSIMARCHVYLSDITDAREFIYYAECVQRDIAEERKQRDMAQGRMKAQRSIAQQKR
jgi:hypothetical protein